MGQVTGRSQQKKQLGCIIIHRGLLKVQILLKQTDERNLRCGFIGENESFGFGFVVYCK